MLQGKAWFVVIMAQECGKFPFAAAIEIDRLLELFSI
jgi:hypothetical protein